MGKERTVRFILDLVMNEWDFKVACRFNVNQS